MPIETDAPEFLAGRWQQERPGVIPFERDVIHVQMGRFRATIRPWESDGTQFTCKAQVLVHDGCLPNALLLQPFPTLAEAQAACEEAFRAYRAEVRRECEALGFEVREPGE